VNIVVGDDPQQFNFGWSDGVCYVPISNAQVGDSIEFNFNGHNVYKLNNKKSFDECDFSGAELLASFDQSFYRHTITQTDLEQLRSLDVKGNETGIGNLFFACMIGSHCFGEQKLRVEVSLTAEQSREKAPVSKFIMGTSSDVCRSVQNGGQVPDVANGILESTCSEPVSREPNNEIDRPYYYRSCLSPPITLTPGGVINQAIVTSYPYPFDRRVLLGKRIWEFVQGDPDSTDGLQIVNLNQLYVHHIIGDVVKGNGAESVRRSDEDAAFHQSVGFLTGDTNDVMVFHLIDLRETGDKWLECAECRCNGNVSSTYTDSIFSGRNDLGGGIICCSNCTNMTSPTIDYRLRYNVTYSELNDLNKPVKPLTTVTTDIAPAVGGNIEFDVPSYENLPLSHRLPEDNKVQVLERMGNFQDIFNVYLSESSGIQNNSHDTIEIYRCTGHLHIGGIKIWLEDATTGEIICHHNTTYGNDPLADVGFLTSIAVNNYDPPIVIKKDLPCRLITHYNATSMHTGVMGLLSVDVSEQNGLVGPQEASLTANICSRPICNASSLPSAHDIEICKDNIGDSVICSYFDICDCQSLLSHPFITGGCDDPISTGGGRNFTPRIVCQEYCGCEEKSDEDKEALLVSEFSNVIEKELQNLCHYSTESCHEYLSNLYSCADPSSAGVEDMDDIVRKFVTSHGKQFALKNSKLGDPMNHRLEADQQVLPCTDALNSKASAGNYFQAGVFLPFVTSFILMLLSMK
jgi:hypothetical protein